MARDHLTILAEELSLGRAQVKAAVELIDAGNTIPFIARYRKEATGSMDDQVLRHLAERLAYLRNLDKRREEIAKALAEQGALTDALQAQLDGAATLSEIEDIYRPYRPKRRTRATVARERGLEPLANWLLVQPTKGDVPAKAASFIDPDRGVPNAETALGGARDIIAEMISDSAELRKQLRAVMMREGIVASKAAKDEDSVYRNYYDYREPVRSIAAHRILAINRGEREGFIRVSVEVPEERAARIVRQAFVRGDSPAAQQVGMACDDAWSRLLLPSLEREMPHLWSSHPFRQDNRPASAG